MSAKGSSPEPDEHVREVVVTSPGLSGALRGSSSLAIELSGCAVRKFPCDLLKHLGLVCSAQIPLRTAAT